MHRFRLTANSRKANIQDGCAWLVFSLLHQLWWLWTKGGLLSSTKNITVIWPMMPPTANSLSKHCCRLVIYNQSLLVTNCLISGRFRLQTHCKIYTVKALLSMWSRLATDLFNERVKTDLEIKIKVENHYDKYQLLSTFYFIRKHTNVHDTLRKKAYGAT